MFPCFAVELKVKVEPEFHVADIGRPVTLHCHVSPANLGPSQQITWLHNGNPVDSTRDQKTLIVPSFQFDDRGVYQCLVRDGLSSAQGQAVVTIGGKFISLWNNTD